MTFRQLSAVLRRLILFWRPRLGGVLHLLNDVLARIFMLVADSLRLVLHAALLFLFISARFLLSTCLPAVGAAFGGVFLTLRLGCGFFVVAAALHAFREEILYFQDRLRDLLLRHHPFAAGRNGLFELFKFISRDFNLALAGDEAAQALAGQVDTGDDDVAVRRLYFRARVGKTLPCLVVGFVLVTHAAHEPAAYT